MTVNPLQGLDTKKKYENNTLTQKINFCLAPSNRRFSIQNDFETLTQIFCLMIMFSVFLEKPLFLLYKILNIYKNFQGSQNVFGQI